MPSSYLIFDFGEDEKAAQQARHKVEGWKQGFRLGEKLAIKFEREQREIEGSANGKGKQEAAAEDPPDGKHKGKKKTAAGTSNPKSAPPEDEKANGKVRLIVRLNFSDHEKLSLQRWLDRIPTEEPFKSAGARVIKANDSEFNSTEDLFRNLD